MDLINLAEYGVAIVAIGALVYVVTLFARFVRSSQDKFAHFVKSSQDNMLNHITDSTKASQKLSSTIDEMLRWLEHNSH